MGCDIHIFAEVRKNGKWESTGKVFKNPYYRPNEKSTIHEDGSEWNAEFTAEPYSGRNYDLFAILADVRNGRGFAGIKTGEGFNPIAEPKGVPNDVCPEIQEEYESWGGGGDGHSHSYFTIKELRDYDWGQFTMHRGVFSFEQYKKYKETGEFPQMWSAMISGPNIAVIEEDEADKMIANPNLSLGTHVNAHWAETYSESAGNFLTKTIPALEALGEPEDVRIVFWFDN